MKILCLHGAYGSASNFQAQLSPLISAAEKPGSVEFKWIDGAHDTTPPKGFETYFGAPPLYRFIAFDDINILDDMLSRIRDIPQGAYAEDTMRQLIGDNRSYTAPAILSAMDRLLSIIDDDPEIEGVLGYSEGATTAATLIVEERRRFEQDGRPRRLKSGIFFAGWPPMRVNGSNVEYLLADEAQDMIDVPTCHIFGSKDPYIHGAITLFGMCDEDKATLFDHGKGHTVPRDGRTIQELASALEKTWTMAMAAGCT